MKWIVTFEKFDLTKDIDKGKFPELPMKGEVREKPMPTTQRRKGEVIKIPNWKQY